MTTERADTAISVRVFLPYRIIRRGPAAVSFVGGLTTIEGVSGDGSVALALDEIDEVVEERFWFWTRLTFRSRSGAAYSIGGLPTGPAASLAASLHGEAAELAEQIGDQLLDLQAQLNRALAGERYLRYGEGEKRRRRIELALPSARPVIVRARLGGAALAALDRLDAVAAAEEFERARTDANRRFVSAAISAVNDAARQSFGITPTDEQAAVIATDEETTLVLAGAGAGKTSVITGKVAHLVRNCGVLPEEILVLAFNRKAADEVRVRISDDLTGVVVRTFHAFGREVIGDVSSAPKISRLAEDPLARSRAFDQIIDDLMSSATDADQLTTFAAYHSQPYRSPFDFDSLSDYRGYVRATELRTLSGDQVKSYEELEIANFLALNGIAFKYEAAFQADTADPRHRQYQPDFYLPDDDIYIEHFALDASGQPPSSWPNYGEGVLWKRNLHRKYGTRLIETYSSQAQDGSLLPKLEQRLRDFGVRFEPTPIERLLGNLRNIIASWLGQLLATFLNLVKTAGLTMEELRRRAVELPQALRSTAFLDLFERVWNRYEQLLEAEDAIDFDDLINRATDAIRSGRWASPFRYVLVDEFQDISAGRLALIQSLSMPGVGYFLVGDDWQSINRFAGSDVGLMASCGDYLGFVERRELTRTFRYGESIIQPSSAFVQRNPEQTRRTLRGGGGGADDGLTIIAATEQTAGVAQALADIAARVPPEQEVSVLVLGRYRKSLRSLRNLASRSSIQVQSSTIHSAKGREADYVIVLDLNDGLAGFPSRREDDPLLDLVLSEASAFPHAEERRLFYVAMTRARRRAYLIADAMRPSAFVRELRREQPELPQIGRFVIDDAPPCPRCNGRLVVSRSARTRRCTNHPFCAYQAPRCGSCAGGYMIIAGGQARCTNAGCGATARACPRCAVGMLRLIDGPYGKFWGCSEYYAEPPCTYRRSAEARASRR